MTLALSNSFKELEEITTLISSDDLFKEKYGFTLTEYMKNRARLAEVCQEAAESIRKHVRNTGIARMTGGSVGVASGTCAVIGIILSPFTFGASLGLTIAGITGGIASAGTSIGSVIAQEAIIANEKKKFTELMDIIKTQESEVIQIFDALHKLGELRDTIKQLTEEEKLNFSFLDCYILGGKSACRIGRLADSGVDLGKAIYTAATAGRVVEEAAEVAPAIAARTAVAATSTTAKVFSGIFAGVGIAFSIYDIYSGVIDFSGSKLADGFEQFCGEYKEQTEIFKKEINNCTQEKELVIQLMATLQTLPGYSSFMEGCIREPLIQKIDNDHDQEIQEEEGNMLIYGFKQFFEESKKHTNILHKEIDSRIKEKQQSLIQLKSMILSKFSPGGTVTEETVTGETVTEETVTGETVTEETVTEETVTEEMVTEETINRQTVTGETNVAKEDNVSTTLQLGTLARKMFRLSAS